MISLNRIQIIGRLAANPEMRYTSNGTPVATFSVATSRKFKKDEQFVEEVEWHSVVVYGNFAEICNQNLQKGSQVYVEGRMHTHSWNDTNNQPHSKSEIIASTVFFSGQKLNGTTPKSDEPPIEDLPPNDIPF